MADRAREPHREQEGGPWLSIGALSRATGIPVETLRTWEHRYGFPKPDRKPSGHRVYPLSSVQRLQRIAAALAHGHRPAQVVGASDDQLDQLLEVVSGEGSADAQPAAQRAPTELSELLEVIESFDADRLTRVLLADWARLDPIAFIEQRIGPLLGAVGDAWAAGRLGVRHEHFLSERVGDLLRMLRLRLEERARGPRFVLATLPGEIHELGLQMAGVALASAGCTVVYLGPDVPNGEIAEICEEVEARVVAVSISSATRGPASIANLRRLRELLPASLELIVGGDGAPPAQAGYTVIPSFAALRDFALKLDRRG